MEEIQKFNHQDGMTSLEIAEVTGKQHAHVMRDIRSLLEQGVSQSNFGLSSYQQPQPNGGYKEVPCYNLTPKGCLILASGYDPVLREKIINRLEELETQKRNGGFQIPQSFSEALMLAAKQQETIEEQEKRLTAAQPALTFTAAVTGAASSCLIGELAKLIDQNGYPMGERRLFRWLRENGYLGTRGERYNIPNQRYIDMGLFELKKGVRTGSGGVLHTTITPKVTGRGQVYFVNKFLSMMKEAI
ncbi:Rha family transcriptional regulator [Prevotella sp. KH2C16]|uniref:Rha family transcriptional regulator n=1 Tax=Prevotella sp. KH2C16 TaxID=1855325 RepID=UPI0008E2B6BC|nr:phage antirepressor KilAC domain-containing protein [Prevotella sp. KH2C16]SFG12820.1 anti-repressor protein [Prevotella sp. KH2C16]